MRDYQWIWVLSLFSSTMACISGSVSTNKAPTRADLGLMPSVADFFPEISLDFSRVKWGHAVNSRTALKQSLEGKDMMIEADVSLGTITTSNSSEILPIMAHPPATTSDLSLEEFLDTILRSGARKGIKLDFKDLSIVEPALKMIKGLEDKITVPLWLNADIIGGPVDSKTKPLDADEFLGLIKNYFPKVVLSVGWTTRFGPDITAQPITIVNNGFYSVEHVKELRDALLRLEIHQPVTFPIRAGIAASEESQKNLMWLLDQVPDSTLTVWSAVYDTVNVPGLMKLIQNAGKDRVFIDVPDGLHCQIKHFDEDLDD